MDNTLENKKKLFCQYFGQKVVCASISDKRTSLMHQTTFTYPDEFKNHCLVLKPLSSITDEDQDYILRDKTCNSMELVQEDKIGAFFHSDVYVTDYLRSKGYALPWMGLSVEKQIEYGWVKLEGQP
ncbi:hypothetical protein [Pedobacter zeae]|uniref:Uncharacterized protein n=1 Tax=Pedobacter zeae TaxID=1737356 RepID=A0A7W6KBN7_9SPHI|nr:hypothetical protein [Pedobacter zeae]MBB4107720.1 hypothetical protein [Pedobacter zeae]GGG97494.1 hypothetical protein GCM10007422_09330 [Pedobacter zeae]